MTRLAVLSLSLLLCSGCFTRTIAKKMGISGWFRADVMPTAPDKYKERFTPISMADVACGDLRPLRDAKSPVIVLVHGVGGDGPEMEQSLATLMQTPPASIFMFRWVSYSSRDEIADALSKGINHLVTCLPEAEGRLLILAHSAGGVVSTFAAHELVFPPATRKGPWATLLTVASPLAGTVERAGNPDGREEAVFLLDLGTRITSYPAAAPGLRVVHLRTHAPADSIMKPTGGRLPNDPSVGCPGAPQLDLPEGLDHTGAMVYVAGEVAADRWKQWCE
jgi:hypothetical protein